MTIGIDDTVAVKMPIIRNAVPIVVIYQLALQLFDKQGYAEIDYGRIDFGEARPQPFNS
jgi:hypothetical protein